MALKDQPYFPLYVQDVLTDEKLIECSAQAQGVYFRLMCVLHKQPTYGKYLLKQKYKQTSKQNIKQVSKFACALARPLALDVAIIEESLIELLDEGVLQIEDDYLWQKRMVKDGEISEKRSKAGRKGGKSTQKTLNNIKSLDKKENEFASNFAKAKTQANSEYEIEYEYEVENKDTINKNVSNWKEEIIDDQMFIENTCMTFKIKKDQVPKLLEEFIRFKTGLEENTWRDFSQMRKNFYFWLNKKKQNGDLQGSANGINGKESGKVSDRETSRQRIREKYKSNGSNESVPAGI